MAGGTPSPSAATAVMIAAEGIVGNWNPPNTTPTLPTVNLPENIQKWPSSVRAHMMDEEFRRGLTFSGDATAATPLTLSRDGTALFELERPGDQVFKDQLVYMRNYADLRADRLPEISLQISDLLSFFSPIVQLRPQRHRYTMQLIDAIMSAIVFCHMQFKHRLACPRPIDYSAQVQPLIATPGHGTLPSGHATEAYAIAVILAALVRVSGRNNEIKDAVYEMLALSAGRIAVNRTIAGLHFPVDNIAGLKLGTTLASHLLDVATGNNPAAAQAFAAADFDNNPDFQPEAYVTEFKNDVPDLMALLNAGNTAETPNTNWLLQKAISEWR